MQLRDQVGSERGCGLLDGVCRARLSFPGMSRAVKVSVSLSLSSGGGCWGRGAGVLLVSVRFSLRGG
ncbi:unnamed protein product, partial [Staurois parvus]